MSVSGIEFLTGHGLAIVAALVGLGFLLLGRRSAPPAVLMTMTVVLALSGVLAVVQLTDLQPTHALLTDSESTAPQKVIDQADNPDNINDAEQGALPTTAPDDTGDTAGTTGDTRGSSNTDDTHDTGNSDQGHPPEDQSPDPGDADPGGGQTEPSPPAEEPAPTLALPDPPPLPGSPSAEASPSAEH